MLYTLPTDKQFIDNRGFMAVAEDLGKLAIGFACLEIGQVHSAANCSIFMSFYWHFQKQTVLQSLEKWTKWS